MSDFDFVPADCDFVEVKTEVCAACEDSPATVRGLCGDCWAESGGTGGIYGR